ncbi:hypothetical protein KAFR_0F01350 [Kazachstania africana CBS 2517]|uniref:DNA helicase n=1 Tax=Kazachstania africana (strain ATCC 22294 / BCRC 22015 / CBS 2517 / CECT 1963 / NBRC 1671 / NRRL Y-8276) TaxID=1071382 RepID=H2AWI1_KAZAF|nr:hypothetical protein KAFR_0F01350 [Kazachstania africana CBS 2517]CCF58731.1 hypothetical protein KAFR_0F01350 [Kazachstania africana CBS 2517]
MSNGDLKELGLVNVLSQHSIEQKIENDLESISNRKLIEQEEQRLERSQNLLDKHLSKKRYLERKLNNATRISVKEKLRGQIHTLQNDEIQSVKDDINDIEDRLRLLKDNVSKKNVTHEGRKQDESEKDYLIRTGQITAFGSSKGFTLDLEASESAEEETKEQEKNFVKANEQMFENITDEEKEDTNDSDYIENEVNEDIKEEFEESSDVEEYEDEETLISRPSEAKDDGDEYFYQKRLKKWITQRSDNRKVDKFPDLPEWRKPHPNIPDARLNELFKIPGEIYSLLFGYQKTCVQWLYELFQQQSGGIIGDEMGLGKTIQVIAFVASLHHSGLLNGPVLIVCPATVMKQWVNELHHWWPPLRAIILHAIGSGMSMKKKLTEDELEQILLRSTPDEFSYNDFQKSSKAKYALESDMNLVSLIDKVVNNGHILITTYVGLRIHSDKLLKINWAYAILDEGHKIRNPNSEIAITCKKLKTRNRIILSGTPIQNNLNELWSLFDFILPGKLGTLPVFQQQFVMPINMGGYANASNIQVQTGYKCAVTLRDIISPYLLRRVKSDVAKDLPHKKEMVLFCKLTQYQRNKYIEFLNSKELSEIKGGKRHVLYGIDILRKICNHPDILDKDKLEDDVSYGNPKRSGKMQVVKQLLLLWKDEGHKTLLFTQSRQMLDILEQFISYKDPEMENINYLRMDGTTNISKRQELVDRFNNENYDLFLLTTRVGGLGVNLTGANRIIIFDPDWNPSTDMQARERAWRIGQKREVSIYRLMVSGSIEEKIYHRQIFKQFLTNKILSDPKQKRFFKMNELHDLFSLGGDDGVLNERLTEEVQKHTANLKNSKTTESDDLEQVVQIQGVSKLEGFYSGKEQKEASKNEDDRLIEGLLGGESNLENAKTHEDMVTSHMKSASTSNLITKEANKVAAAALDALRKSRKSTRKYEIGTPTWTGKFGSAGKINKSKGKLRKQLGSSQILANIKRVQQGSAAQNDALAKININRELLERIQVHLNKQIGFFSSSVNIIENIGLKLSEEEDVIKARALLKTVATFHKEKRGWILNEEFRTG